MSNLENFETVNDEYERRSLVRKQFDYMSKQLKAEKAILRTKFLETCVASKLIPRFLQKVNFPKIEAYDRNKIERFQRTILKDELNKAKKLVLEKERVANESKNMFLETIPQNLLKEEVDRKIKVKINYDIDE